MAHTPDSASPRSRPLSPAPHHERGDQRNGQFLSVATVTTMRVANIYRNKIVYFTTVFVADVRITWVFNSARKIPEQWPNNGRTEADVNYHSCRSILNLEKGT